MFGLLAMAIAVYLGIEGYASRDGHLMWIAVALFLLAVQTWVEASQPAKPRAQGEQGS